MLDVDSLVADCIRAAGEDDPRLAVRQVLERVVADDPLRADRFMPTPGLTVLYNSPELTVLDVVWPPLISLFPHDHRMWAAIGIYGGQEDNTFYRRQGGGIVTSGGKELRERDVLLLGDDAIHAVCNPMHKYTGAIHVYGGDFIAMPRSQWDAETLTEEPYDLEAVKLAFERADQMFQSNQL
jgi:predicted metal-dependent enzyme (double-stranded beta helix superfamily)